MNILYHHRTRGLRAEGNHIKSIVDAFRAQGHVVKILSFPGADPEKIMSGEEDSPKAKTTPSPTTKLLKWLAEQIKNAPSFVFEVFEILYNVMVPKRLNNEIQALKPDFIYERYSLFMFTGVLLAKLKKVPILIEVNDSALVSRIRPITFGWLARKIEQWVFKNSSGVVFISTYFRDLAIQEYGAIAPTVITPNAADIAKFDLTKYDKAAVKQALGLAGKIVAGYTGGFGRWHGIAWFIEKIVPRIKDNPNLCLLLVGDGETFDDVSAVIKQAGMEQQIILTGRVKSQEVPKYLAAMDFGFLPELNEYCSPMKLFESMAMAQGMVLPASDPVKEVVTDGVTSWYFTPKDQEACINKVMTVFEDAKQRQAVGQNARRYIETERQWTDNTNLVYTLLPTKS